MRITKFVSNFPEKLLFCSFSYNTQLFRGEQNLSKLLSLFVTSLFSSKCLWKQRILLLEFFLNAICIKWMDNRTVTLLRRVGNLNQIFSVLHRQKGASSKSTVPCPIIIKKYRQSMVVLIFSISTLQHIILTDDPNFVFTCAFFFFFDLMDAALVNSFIICDRLHPNALSFLYFKLVLSKSFIGSFTT